MEKELQGPINISRRSFGSIEYELKAERLKTEQSEAVPGRSDGGRDQAGASGDGAKWTFYRHAFGADPAVLVGG